MLSFVPLEETNVKEYDFSESKKILEGESWNIKSDCFDMMILISVD